MNQRNADKNGIEVCVSARPEEIRECIRKGIPCVYLEYPDSEPVYECSFVWQMTEEAPFPDEDYLEKVYKRWHHLPLMIAETERLLIRESVIEDLESFRLFYEEERENPDIEPLGTEAERALAEYIRYQYPFWDFGLWSVEKKGTKEVIGRMGLEVYEDKMELSYLIGRAFRREGYASEAAKAILQYAREKLELKEVYLRTSKGNMISQKLAESLGFQKVGKAYQKILDSEKTMG
ncbi:MAG: GNAT family N-acetyltransferase [Muricoprocola sp.]